MRFKDLVGADLLANTGRTGFLAGVSAALYHPGFGTLFMHRTARALADAGWKRLANLVWRANVTGSGCHLHLAAEIGPGLLLPHPTGIVVGSGCRIGPGVTLYQNVTLGRGRSRDVYPTVEAGAVIYPNAVVVGDVVVGAEAVVGAGSVVIDGVAPATVVSGNPARPLKSASAERRTDESATGAEGL